MIMIFTMFSCIDLVLMLNPPCPIGGSHGVLEGISVVCSLGGLEVYSRSLYNIKLSILYFYAIIMSFNVVVFPINIAATDASR